MRYILRVARALQGGSGRFFGGGFLAKVEKMVPDPPLAAIEMKPKREQPKTSQTNAAFVPATAFSCAYGRG
jgi:hypothetical protein